MNSIYRIIFITGIISIIASAVLFLLNYNDLVGPPLILGLIMLSTGFQGFKYLKSFSYTVGIMAAVTVSMFYPRYFISIGGFELKLLIVPLLQIIMFGMGSQLSLSDFVNVIKMPKAVFIGLLCQFTIMPILGITIAKTFGFPPEIAAGVVLIGCAPSGLASNVMNYIAKANVPLSITVTAFATLLSPFLTPTLMKFLAGQFVPVDFWKMMVDIIDMVILPIIAGLIFNGIGYRKVQAKKFLFQILAYVIIVALKNLIFLKMGVEGSQITASFIRNLFWFILLPLVGGWLFRKLTGGKKELIDSGLALISMVGIGIIITIITATGRESLMQIGLLLIAACFIHNTFGYMLGYWFSRFLGMDERSCRTIAIEVGMQNGGLASGIALQMGKVATIGLAPAVFGPLMNVTGSSLASWWRGRPPDKSKNDSNENTDNKHETS
ncbi:MAG TPA: bile acid:sodium symporter family protein [Cyclobacteriaceae bacterium]|nr:bile acid:sodium symporter family protein [Cyclobacteriaceae bacterium]